jgi:hypothetical protein
MRFHFGLNSVLVIAVFVSVIARLLGGQQKALALKGTRDTRGATLVRRGNHAAAFISRTSFGGDALGL